METTSLLLDRVAEINTTGNIETPLHLAALYGRKEIVQLLIEQGADADAKTSRRILASQT